MVQDECRCFSVYPQRKRNTRDEKDKIPSCPVVGSEGRRVSGGVTVVFYCVDDLLAPRMFIPVLHFCYCELFKTFRPTS